MSTMVQRQASRRPEVFPTLAGVPINEVFQEIEAVAELRADLSSSLLESHYQVRFKLGRAGC